ncbi:MFS transporter [Sinirhodobacter populi]|uniref:MFS transporter n=1 Tax=Paenirhodobacter populi TaxID=2306993 RepID=A0A443K3T4_9RHOB|nr:MFS transporter [Sinirhodobacter populi]RWR27424.1 MFS transporter [Sinirhodobacter populi]
MNKQSSIPYTHAVPMMALVLLAANLRPALTTVGLLIEPIRETTGISLTTAGLLNSLPLLALGIFAPLGHFGRRFGLERTLVAALFLLTAGILVRSQGSVAALFLGSACLAAGIAVGNVLVPGIIKRDFADRAKGVTTIYAVTLGLSAAIASGLAVPLSQWLPGGWRGSLGIWAIPAAITALVWLPAARRLGANNSPSHHHATPVSPWRSMVAWLVTIFMGMQSLFFYVAVGWFPTVFQNRGYSPEESGLIIVVFQLVALIVTMIMPLILRRAHDQAAIAAGAAFLVAISVLGLIYLPSATYFWMVTMGIGGGAMMILALAFISLRSANHHEAASLSIMSQSVGYLLAAGGPVCFGLLHDLTAEWNMPLWVLVALATMSIFVGFGAGRNRTFSSVTLKKQS